jgi:hypothetical protein
MPILEQIVTYNSSYFPANSTGSKSYTWAIYLSDGVTLANNTHYTLVNGTLPSSANINVQWHTVGDYKVKLTITQNECGSTTVSPPFDVPVTGDNVLPVGCVTYNYTGGGSGGTISYTFCDGISTETVAVAPGEVSSLCCLENPAPTITGTVTATLGSSCNPVSTFGKDMVLSYWLQDCNDFINCDADNYLFPNCNPHNYDTGLQSNSAEGRLKSYNRRDLLKPPFYANYHSVRNITNNQGFTGPTDYSVRFDQAAFDRTMAFVYEAGVKAVELYFYDDDSDVSEHIRYNQTTTSPLALSVQYCYALGALGYNSVTTMDRIVSHMAQSRYYKVGNRPVITVDNPEGDKFHVDRYIEASGATFVVDINEPGGGYYTQNPGYSGTIIFGPASGYVRSSGNTPNRLFLEYIKSRYAALNGGVIPYSIIEGTFFYHSGSGSFGQDAVSAYSVPHPTFNNDHSYQTLIDYNISQLTAMGTTAVVPTITAGFNNVKRDGQDPNYVNTPTEAELIAHFNAVKNANTNSPFYKSYSLGEAGESGQSNFLPRKNPDGSYDKTYINILKKILTS